MTETDKDKIVSYLVNPVESRIASISKPLTLDQKTEDPYDVALCEAISVQMNNLCLSFHLNWVLRCPWMILNVFAINLHLRNVNPVLQNSSAGYLLV